MFGNGNVMGRIDFNKVEIFRKINRCFLVAFGQNLTKEKGVGSFEENTAVSRPLGSLNALGTRREVYVANGGTERNDFFIQRKIGMKGKVVFLYEANQSSVVIDGEESE